MSIPNAPTTAHCSDAVQGVHTAGGTAQCGAETRTVSGLVLPWNTQGATTAGAIQFRRNGIRVPAELSRCKLHLNHTGTPGHRVVGHAIAHEYRPDGLHMTFRIATTADGDAAITDVRERVRDAFSAEVAGIRRDGAEVFDSVLNGVALVDTPAFTDARVEALHASYNPAPPIPQEKDNPMNVKDFIAALIRAGATEAAARAEATTAYGAEAVAAVNSADLPTPPTAAPASAEIDAAKVAAAVQQTQAPAPGAPAGGQAQASYTPLTPAVLPAGLPGGANSATEAKFSADQAADTLRLVQLGRGADVAHAALANITNSAMTEATPPQWLGELWDGRDVPRRIIPLLGHRPLESWRIEGFTWTKKPMVAAYEGDKTEIPTNEVAIAPYDAEATRWAGGHDLDRKFYDFPDSRGIIKSYWRAMNNSYAVVTDVNALDWTIANATPTDSATDLFRAIITADSHIDDALGVSYDYVFANPADKLALLDIKAADLSAYISLFNVDLSKVVWTKRVPAGTLIAGAKPAAVHYELPGSPLRVEAEHLSHGGRDAALFGYTALTLDNPDGLVKVQFGGAVTPPAGG